MALGRVSRNEQSCRACKFLSFEIPGVTPGDHVAIEFEGIPGEPTCSLNKIDFVEMLGLDDHHEMANKVPQLRSGEFVEIGNMIYRIETGKSDRIRVSKADSDPEAACNLVRSLGLDDIEEDIPEELLFMALIAHGVERKVILEQTIDKTAYESGDYADFIKWQDVIPADPTVDYIPVGTRYQAIIEPALHDNGCSLGINKVSGVAFSRYIEIESSQRQVRHLAKELWGNDAVLAAVKNRQSLTTCRDCGFPMPKERLDKIGIDYCVWCSEEMEESQYEEIHSRYLKIARNRIYIDKHTAIVTFVYGLNVTPVVMASTLNLKLSAFFRRSETMAFWEPVRS